MMVVWKQIFPLFQAFLSDTASFQETTSFPPRFHHTASPKTSISGKNPEEGSMRRPPGFINR